ncbi:TPA: hypothetical protein JIZ10_03330 [Acinetobacter baumannii]|nr:hypothetical protein [Acinetobacter baumannii]HAV5029378.1 hypothetical protein [Acinetobacter baumannii]
MTDLNKLRSEFEVIPEIKAHLDHGNVFWSDKNQTYASEFQCLHAVACYVNGAWFMFQEKAKAQAVPEGYCLVPKEIPDSVVSCLENSGFHWGDGTRDHYTPIYSLMVEVASESGAEG